MKIADKIYLYPERGLLDCNTYLIDGDTRILVDPGLGHYVEGLLRDMKRDGFDPEDVDLIVVTHLHVDHCGGCRAFKEISSAKIGLHSIQEKHLDVAEKVSAFFGMDPVTFTADVYIGEKIDSFEVLHTPGHSPESLCFYHRDEGILICGDLVFKASVGRTDLPGGNGEEMKRSIINVSKLRIEHLLPGHMGIVQGEKNVRKNFDFIQRVYFSWI
ncbi:MAG: MBL fold metallo-hydrolase [Candidatus Syntropharchaeia archaeon]